jgi:anaerobic dimethyl sulfoxide reductase subunit C (anchor subunit)
MGMLAGRSVLSVLGVAILLYALNKSSKAKALSTGTIYLALILVLVGEFMGRYLFYASGVSPIIGG